MRESGRIVRVLTALVVTAALSACVSGGANYKQPEAQQKPYVGERTFAAPLDQVWKALSAYLAESALSVDALDKDSRFVNVTFSAEDPTLYADCGAWEVWAQRGSESRSARFKGAQPVAQYPQAREPFIDDLMRTVELGGQATIYLEEAGKRQTVVKIRARYAMTKRTYQWCMGEWDPRSATTHAFTTAEGSHPDPSGMYCRPTNAFESEILDGIAAQLAKPPLKPVKVLKRPAPKKQECPKI